MSEVPSDLVPLPTSPWDERPGDLPLDREEVRTALWRASGSVSNAATLLKVSSGRLRKFIANSAYLQAEAEEAREQIVDYAEDVVMEELRDPDKRGPMARFILGSQRGKKRGWGAGNAANIEINQNNTIIQWGDGTTVAVPVRDKVIDHE
jgi:hypothetical protein